MKRLILTIIILTATAAVFALPAKKITLDAEDASQGFATQYVQQGQVWNLDCYIEADGVPYLDIATVTGKAYYGGSTTASAWASVDHSAIDVEKGVVSFQFLPADLNTNGVYEMYIILETAEGYPFVSGKGRINIAETTVTGVHDPLTFATPINFDLWDASGDLDFGGGTISNIILGAGIGVDWNDITGDQTDVLLTGFDATGFLVTESQISDLDKDTSAEVDAKLAVHTGDTANPHDTSLANLTDTVQSALAERQAWLWNGTNWANRLLVEADIDGLDKYTQAEVDAEIDAITVVSSGAAVNDWYFTAGASAVPRGTATTETETTNEDQIINTIAYDPEFTDYLLFPEILRQDAPETVVITVPTEDPATYTFDPSDGRLTHVAESTQTAEAIYTSDGRTISRTLTLTYDTNGTQAYIINGIANSVRKDATEAIDTLIASNTDVDFYAGYDWTAEPTAVTHNVNSWAYTLRGALECVSPWASGHRGNERSGTLISPIHFVNANHFSIANGATIKWVAGDGTIHSRTVASQMRIGGSDIRLYVMNEALPATMTVAKFLPSNYETYLPTRLEELPVVFIDKREQVYLRDGRATSTSSFSNPILSERVAVSKTPEDGDSGNPVLMIIGGEPVLLTTWTQVSSGPDYTALRADIEAGMVALGGGYTEVEQIDLSGFTTTF